MNITEHVLNINSEEELRKLHEEKLHMLKQALELQNKDYKKVSDALSSAGNMSNLLNKFIELYNTTLRVNNSLFRARGSGDFPIYGAPKPFDDMRKVNAKVEQFLQTINKLIKHLRDDKTDLEKYEWIILSATKMTKANFHKRFSINPLNGFRNTDFIPDRNLVLGHLRREIVNLDSELKSLESNIKVNESDLELFSLSLRFFIRLKEAMVSYKKNIPKIKMRFPPGYEDSIKGLIDELDILIRLIEHISDDEDFIRATNINIIKLVKELEKEDRLLLGR